MSWLRTSYRAVGPPRRWLRYLLEIVILLCLYIIKPFRFVKLCLIRVDRISLSAGTTDLLVRRLQLENTPQKRILYVGIVAKPINEQLLRMSKRKFPKCDKV